MRILCGLSVLVIALGLTTCGGGEEADEPLSSGPEAAPGGSTSGQPDSPPADSPSEPPGDPETPASSRAETLASEYVASLHVDRQYSGLADQILATFKVQYPEMTEEEAAIVRNHLLEALERDFEKKLAANMVEYFTVEDLEALKNKQMTPELEKKLPGWQEFSRERAREWGKQVGREAADKAMAAEKDE
jgi:hypothetical protein